MAKGGATLVEEATLTRLKGNAPLLSRRRGSRLAILARRKPLGAISMVLLIVVALACYLGPFVLPFDATETSTDRLVGPNATHLAGTDQFGRDVLARTLAAGRISLLVGLVSAALGGTGGLLIGTLSAHFSGYFDRATQALVDAFIAIPGLVLLLAAVSLFSPGVATITAALAFGSAIRGSRTLRAAAFAIQQEPYLLAARTLGAHPVRVIGLHMMPNLMAPMITITTLSVASAILAEAGLSFLGYGIQPPTPTWGGMMSGEARPYLILAPWIMIAPSIALGVTVYSINMFGDALRDVLDPRLRGR